jgi:hypothetical protein
VGKHKERRPLGLLKHRLEDNIKMYLINIKEDRALNTSASGKG